MMKYYGQDFEFMSREIIMMKAECEKKSIDSTNQTGSFWDRYMSSINLRWIASLDQ